MPIPQPTMPLYIIDIAWHRRSPQDGKPAAGTATRAVNGRSLTHAISKAKREFHLHYGMHLAIDRATEKPDPAGIFH